MEKKSVQGNLISKQREEIREEEGEQILRGEIQWMKDDERTLVRDFYLQSMLNELKYSHMMEFVREIYHYDKQDYVVFSAGGGAYGSGTASGRDRGSGLEIAGNSTA